MPVCVVELFEVVDIDHRQRQPPFSPVVRDEHRETLAKRAMIGIAVISPPSSKSAGRSCAALNDLMSDARRRICHGRASSVRATMLSCTKTQR
jgi:hypothetical protein